MASLNTNVSNAAPPRDFDVMPAGEYVAQIIESDVVPTSKGDGRILKLTFEILEGDHTGRKVWENLNIENPNAQAQEIAQSTLKGICDAIGHSGDLQDSEELHGQPMRVRLKIVKDKTGQYSDKNGIGSAKPYDDRARGAAAARPAGQPAQRQAAPPAGGGAAARAATTRPWGGQR